MIAAALLALGLVCGDLGIGAQSLLGALTGTDAVERSVARAIGRIASNLVRVEVDGGSEPDADASPDSDEASPDSEDLVIAPPVPAPPIRRGHGDRPSGGAASKWPKWDTSGNGSQDDHPLPPFTEKGRSVPAVEVLHRIARSAGWSMTLLGVGQETIDVDFENADPREALRQVLQESRSLGVLRGDRLVVLPSSGKGHSGMLVIERRENRHASPSRKRRAGNDRVKIFEGDLTVPAGTVVHGDAVSIGGSIGVEQGGVVEGNAVSVLGSVHVEDGGVVLGDGVAVLGTMDVERGGQVLGEHVQVGLSRVFGGRARRSHTVFSRLGPFGFFPTLALFALVYLCGLLALRAWPDRVRGVGSAIAGAPLRSFFIGFLCWLLLLPLCVLLCISVVGIPLVPLLPLGLFLCIALGLSGVALRIGELLPAGPGQRFVPPAALGMGIAVLLLISFVPFLGTSLLALAQFFALGGAVGSRFGKALPAHV
jgi:hypothetical protein